MDLMNNEELRKIMLKHLNDDLSLSEDEYFTIDLEYISELNKKYNKLGLEIIFSVSSCEDKYANVHGFCLNYFLGFNTKDGKTFFDMSDTIDNFGLCESEKDVDYFADKLKDYNKFKLNKTEIKEFQKYKWEYFAVDNFTDIYCKEALSVIPNKDDLDKLINILDNIL